jgi:hypothetical protein
VSTGCEGSEAGETSLMTSAGTLVEVTPQPTLSSSWVATLGGLVSRWVFLGLGGAVLLAGAVAASWARSQRES